MATILNQLLISHDETTGNVQRDLYAETGFKELAGQKIVNYLKKVTSGMGRVTVKTRIGTTQASGTLTFATVIATDAIKINGVTFTCVASGATGNQWNVGADDTEGAANLAAAINASATALVAKHVTASAASGVVTVTAIQGGHSGNAITLESLDVTITASVTRLEGGLDGDTETTHYFGSAS